MPKTETKEIVKKVVKKAVKKPAKEVVAKETKSPVFAVIKLAGSQIKIEEGQMYYVGSLGKEKDEKIVTEEVLLYSDGKDTKVGKPYIKGAKVEFEVVSNKRDAKLRVFKYKAKSRYRKAAGHRAQLNRILVTKITVK